MRYSILATAAAVAMALGAGAAMAETRVKVTNSTRIPADVMVDGKSKTIRERKTLTFPVESNSPVYGVLFGHGVGDSGQLDFSGTSPVTGGDGASYYCVNLLEDGMEIELESDCEKRVNK